MISRNDGILNFGDEFASGKTYEELLVGIVQWVIGGSVPKSMLWIAKEFGYSNEDEDFEDADLWIRDDECGSEDDGEAHSSYFITTAPPNIKESGYSSMVIYRECLYDADDPGFVGDWELEVSVPIRALCRRKNGKLILKRTSMNIIFRDAVALLSEKIGSIDYR